MRRAIGTILCLVYGFTVPMLAVTAWIVWREHKEQFEAFQTNLRRETEAVGIPVGVDLMVLGPVAAAAAFLIVWFLAGPRTERYKFMLIGFYAFATVFLGLVLIGQR